MKTILTVLCILLAGSLAAGRPEFPTSTNARVEIGKIDAVVVKRVLPKYPVAMWQRGLEGRVVLEIGVDANGKVVDIKTLAASDWVFASEARRAVWQWQFAAPAQTLPDGRVRYLLPIEFKFRSD